MSTFETLYKINVNDHKEERGNLTYLSWAWAWKEVKERFPTAQYTIYENNEGWNYHHDGKTAWVKTGVTIEDQEHIEYLPIMSYNNKSIPLDKITSWDVNKTIQRSITKACARHGLGLYIYAGEDLPNLNENGREKTESQIFGERVTKAKHLLDECVLSDDDAAYEEAIKVFLQAHKEGITQVIDYALQLFPSIDIDAGVSIGSNPEGM